MLSYKNHKDPDKTTKSLCIEQIPKQVLFRCWNTWIMTYVGNRYKSFSFLNVVYWLFPWWMCDLYHIWKKSSWHISSSLVSRYAGDMTDCFTKLLEVCGILNVSVNSFQLYDGLNIPAHSSIETTSHSPHYHLQHSASRHPDIWWWEENRCK